MLRPLLENSGPVCVYAGREITALPHDAVLPHLLPHLKEADINTGSRILCLGNDLGDMVIRLRQSGVNAIATSHFYAAWRNNEIRVLDITRGIEDAIADTQRALQQLWWAYIRHGGDRNFGDFACFLDSKAAENAEREPDAEPPPPWMMGNYPDMPEGTSNQMGIWRQGAMACLEDIFARPHCYHGKSLEMFVADQHSRSAYDAVLATGAVPSDPIQLQAFVADALRALKPGGVLIATPLDQDKRQQVIQAAVDSGNNVSAIDDAGWYGVPNQDWQPLVIAKRNNPASTQRTAA